MSGKDERLSLWATQDQKLLADQQEFHLTPEVWDAFNEALDRPPVEASRLREFLRTPSVLEA